MPLLLISLDGVADHVYESMSQDPITYPNIARLMKKGYYQNNLQSLTPSTTYPTHTSIATGKLPLDHGITSNYHLDKKNKKHWHQYHSHIQSKTIWQAAKEKNLTTASFLWPVTCGAPITYNLPDYHKQKGESQLLKNLKHGSAFFQLGTYLKNKKNLHGLDQPALDNFTTAALVALLKKKTPDLIAIHLIAYDSIFHEVGLDDPARLEDAKTSLDHNLGKLLSVWRNKPVLLFSDHALLNVGLTVNLNHDYPSRTFFQNGGIAFGTRIDTEALDEYWFERYLTKDEMLESGMAGKYAFGLAAKPGYTFSETPVKGDHGYPADYEGTRVFYHYSNVDFPSSYDAYLKGHLFDVTYLIAKELGLELDIVQAYEQI